MVNLKSCVAAACAIIVAGALAACKPAAEPAPAPAAQAVAAQLRLQPTVATVMGKLVATDWYLVIRPGQRVKPLVIWVESESKCRSSANEFNIKAVDPAKKAAPAAHCALGRDLPVLLS